MMMIKMNSLTNAVVVVCISVGVLISEHGGVHAFLPSTTSTNRHCSSKSSSSSSSSPLYSLWTNWIPERTTTDFMDVIVAGPSSSSSSNNNSRVSKKIGTTATTTTAKSTSPNRFLAGTAVFFTAIALSFSVLQPAAYAVSGGGSDFAGTDISNQDFSNQNYKLKDFTQVLARKTNFQKSIFTGCRFQNAYLIDADFGSADLRGVSFERTNMENVVLTNAIASGAYFDQNLLEAKSVENVDFTDAQIPDKILPVLCERPDMKGKNPTTGVDTRDSAMCF